MKIYWKKLIWNYTARYWWKLTHLISHLVGIKDDKHKRLSPMERVLFWDNYWSRMDKKMWNSKQMDKAAEAWASFLPKLDNVIRRVTAKDNAITTVVSSQADQKMYKGGKVIAIRKST